MSAPVPAPADRDSVALVLVRHGATAWSAERRFQGTSNPRISDLGERQARALADRLTELRSRASLGLGQAPPVAIRHSPLARSEQTARIVGEALGEAVPLVPDDHLREIGHGAWEGKTHAEVRERYPTEYDAWRADPARGHAPGGESLDAASHRAGLALHAALAPMRMEVGGQGRPWTLLVAHDGILRLLLLRALGLGPASVGFWAFPFDPCAISVLDLTEATAVLRCHNVTDHLDER